MVKKCFRCKEEKDIKLFNKDSTKKDGLNSYCRKCNSDYLKDHYRRNKQYYIDKRRKLGRDTRKWLREYKHTLKCVKCNEDHPACLDFHHRDSEDKDLAISIGVKRGWSIKRVLSEIKKCDVLCANCHRKLHYTSR